MTKKEEGEICISDEKTIAEIESIQNDIKKKGEKASKTEIVQACIHIAKRYWSPYLEVKWAHEKETKE